MEREQDELEFYELIRNILEEDQDYRPEKEDQTRRKSEKTLVEEL